MSNESKVTSNKKMAYDSCYWLLWTCYSSRSAEKERRDDGEQDEEKNGGEDDRPACLRQRHRRRCIETMGRAIRFIERAQAACI